MRWIDTVKQRRAKLEAKQDAQFENLAAGEAKEAAELAARESRRRNKEIDKFRRSIETRLPVGVEIVDVFWNMEISRDRSERTGFQEGERHSPVGPMVRVDLGKGVRLDLMLMIVYWSRQYGSNMPTYSRRHWHEVDIYGVGDIYDHLFRLTSSKIGRRSLEEALYDALTMEEYRSKNITQ